MISFSRCKLICCCAGCDDQNADAFGDTARLLADLFKVSTDLIQWDVESFYRIMCTDIFGISTYSTVLSA